MVKKKTYRLIVPLSPGVLASSTSITVDLATGVFVIKIRGGAAGRPPTVELAGAGDELEAEDEAEELLEAEGEEGTYGKQRFSALSKQNRSTFLFLLAN